ncbi:phosphate ABC transporter permease subunit PstC [Chloroflexia bacterium SDU3-3]|nr:phosphate ABC transporter permease subunit PstC [Chloroflexia bacterium SDU3-3]
MAQAKNLSAWASLQQRTRHGDSLFAFITLAFALLVVALVGVIGVVTWVNSTEARDKFGISFLFQQGWNPVTGHFGALPAIYGTLISSLIALVIAGPLGVMIGVFLSELCPLRLRTSLSFLVELLAAIPSVVYGMWGVFVLIPFFQTSVANPVAGSIGQWLPFLGGPVSARSLAAAGVVLAIMILPTIASITRDVLAVVPSNQREAMLAVGATQWETIRHAVLPYAQAGIIGGMMLGLGRALGETMAALMIIGSLKDRIEPSIFQASITSASLVASELSNANDELHESTLILIALVLFVITLLLNGLARFIVWRAGRGPVGSARA